MHIFYHQGGRGVRKIIVYELLSLDGVAEDPQFDWDDTMGENLISIIETQDTVILGHRTYNEWAEFWPESGLEPFASFINGVMKYVVASTELDRTWSNTTIVKGDMIEFVSKLKSEPGSDIGVHGSISVARSLLAAGVVDELKLVVMPKILGQGNRLLEDLPAISLEPIRSKISPGGYLLVDYRIVK